MTHQQPPKASLLKFRISIPADERLEREYLDLGWLRCGDELMWSHAKGSPVHPGDHLDASEWSTKWGTTPSLPLLSLLPLAILSEGKARLPDPADCAEPYLEVPVVVLIKYQRSESRKGKSSHHFWTADEAKLIAGSAEPPAD